MGSYISRAYNIILTIPIIYLIINYVKEKTRVNDKKEDFEMEWGQFCDISIPINLEATPKAVTH